MEIGFSKTNSAKSIPVNNKPILGIQFLLSGLGLRAVRVLYEDGFQSPWLGKFPSNGWIGTVLGNDLKALRVLADVSDWYPARPTLIMTNSINPGPPYSSYSLPFGFKQHCCKQ